MIDKLKDALHNRKIIGYFLILSCILVLTLLYGLRSVNTGILYKECFQNEGTAGVTPLFHSGDIVEEKIYADKNGMDGFTLQWATHNNTNTGGTVLVEVLDDNHCNVAETVIDLSMIKDGQTVDVIFDEHKIAGDENYIVRLEFADIDGQTIALWYREDAQEEFFINGETIDAHLSMQIIEKSKDLFCIVFQITMAVLTVLIAVSFVLLGVFKIELCRLYLLCGIVLGSIYITVIPLFVVPDEPSHFYMAYDVSNDLLGVADGSGGISMRREDLETEFLSSGINREFYNQYYEKIKKWKVTDETIEETDQKHLKAYKYQYIFGALGLTLGRVFHLGTGLSYLLGRLFQLFLFVGCVYYAMKRMPFGKELMFLWAILPMTLQQTASYSYDCMILSLCALIIGLSLEIAYGATDKAGKYDKIILLAAVLLLVPAKSFALLPICLFPLLVWIVNGRGERGYAGCVILGIAAISLLVLLFPAKSAFEQDDGFQTNQGEHMIKWANEEGYVLSDFLTNPLKLVEIAGDTLYHQGDIYWTGMLGNYFGWLEIRIPNYLPMIYLFLLFFAVIKKRGEKLYLAGKARAFFFLLSLCGMGMACAGMLLEWTPKSYHVIAGVQGRYFLPFLIPLMLSVRGRSIAADKEIGSKTVFIGIIMQMYVITALFLSAIR